MARRAAPHLLSHRFLEFFVCILLILSTVAMRAESRSSPAEPRIRPADIVRADVAAQDAGDWNSYLELRSDLPGAPESVASYTALWAQPETGIRGNVTSARIDGLQPIPMDIAREAVDTCCYTATHLRAFYVIINYSVRTPNAYVRNGANARLYILAMDEGEWKIVQVSEPLLQPIIDNGYATGDHAEHDLLDQQRERLRGIPQDDVPASASRIHAETTQPYPSTIRVGHFSDFPACQFLGPVTTISFTSYIRDVLPNEWWPAANYNMEALKAGALAVKGVGWHRKAVHFYPNLNVDVADNRCTQAYSQGSAIPRTDAAFCAVTGVAFQKADGLLFYPSYLAGQYNNAGKHGGTMFQNGTRYLADHEYSYSDAYRDILRYYYDNSSSTGGQAVQFFNYNETGTACTATAQPPTAPTGLSAVAISSSAITVSWNGSTNTTTFLIYRWTGSWTQIATVAGSARSFTDNGLASSTTFYYTLCAQNTAGTSCATTNTFATTPAAIFGVLAPTGLTPNNVSVRGTPVHLSWGSVQGALWYNVAVMRWTGSSWVNVSTFYTLGARYDFSTYQTTWYAWRVQAVGLSGGGAWSDWAYFYGP